MSSPLTDLPLLHAHAVQMANITMSPDCKQRLAEKLPFAFFLHFKNDVLSQRTAALCLSELLEDPANQAKIMAQPDTRQGFVRSLVRMTRSYDSECRRLAVKCLMLVSAQAEHHAFLVHSRIVEALFEALSVSPNDAETKHLAMQGLRRLATDRADIVLLLEYIDTGPNPALAPPDDPEYAIHNRSEAAARLLVPLLLKPTAETQEDGSGTVQKWPAATYLEGTVLSDGPMSIGLLDPKDFTVVYDHDGTCYNEHWYRVLHLGEQLELRCNVPGHCEKPELLRNFPRCVVGDVIGIELDLGRGDVLRFYRNGEKLVELLQQAKHAPAGGICPVVFAGPGDAMEWNVGFKPFLHAPPQQSGVVSWLHSYRQQAHVNPKLPVSSVLEVEEADAERWVPVGSGHQLTENMVLDELALDKQRARVLSWLLFLLTLPRDDEFFSPPVVLE